MLSKSGNVIKVNSFQEIMGYCISETVADCWLIVKIQKETRDCQSVTNELTRNTKNRNSLNTYSLFKMQKKKKKSYFVIFATKPIILD